MSGYGVTGNQKLYTLSMKADVFSYGIFLWELITTEVKVKFFNYVSLILILF